MAALEGKNFFSLFLNIDGFSPIHRTHRYFKNQCINTSNIDDQTILPIPNTYFIYCTYKYL
jgi:hypothetical protein